MDQIVLVLDADDRREGSALRHLPRRYVAQPNPADEALSLEIGEDGERRLDGAFGRSMHVEHDAQVDHVEGVDAEVAQVVMGRRS